MLTLRPADARGHANHGWLDSHHTFSFANYYDPRHMGFRALRVINEDRVAPGRGFGTHPHNDMEIISYVLEGGLRHRDSIGTGSVIRPGDVQRMSAGTGVAHSEFNDSSTDPVHFLQIWLIPKKRGVEPSYEQKAFTDEQKDGKLVLIASPDGRENSVSINTDAQVFAGKFGKGQGAKYPLATDRHAWVQVARGKVVVNGRALEAGDGLALSEEAAVEIEGVNGGSELLLFDLG